MERVWCGGKTSGADTMAPPPESRRATCDSWRSGLLELTRNLRHRSEVVKYRVALPRTLAPGL